MVVVPKQAVIGRPGTASARKPPPSVRNNEVVEDRSALENAQPVAGVIVERKNGDDDDDNNNTNNNRNGNNNNNKQGGGGDSQSQQQDWMKLVEQHENATSASRQQIGEGGAKGYLASEALQAKRQQEEDALRRAREEAASGMRQEGVVLHYKGKAGDQGGVVGDSEISKLREQLQLLTKASNPLGKYLEAIFDDIDSMTRELDMWRNEARTQTTAATEAQRQTQEGLREVHSQIGTLEDSIADQLQKVSVVRAQIQKNEATIEKLIRMVINPNEKR
jgi:TRAF3-interacting protein 1